MNRKLSRLQTGLVLSASLLFPVLAAAGTFTWQNVTFPGGLNAYNRSGMNNSGDLVGFYGGARVGGSPRTVNGPSGGTFTAKAIDDSGRFAGTFVDSNNKYSAVYGSDATGWVTLGVPQNNQYVEVTSVSANGIVGGYYMTANSRQVMFEATATSFTTLSYPANNQGQQYLFDVNSSGDFIGLSNCCREGFSYLRQGNTTTAINVPGAAYTVAYGLNDFGQVVGWYDDGSAVHGFLWNQGVITTLNIPGASWVSGFDINNSGQIFGGYVMNGQDFNFLGSISSDTASTPEPSTFLCLGAGLLAIRLRKNLFNHVAAKVS